MRLLPPSWTYFLAVRAVLPELQRSAGLGAADLPQLRSRVRSLIMSASVRFERLLGDRDHLITQTLVAGRNVPFGSPAALTERIAMSLSGAFDSLARALNELFDLGLQGGNQCSFTERKFRNRLPEEVKSAARDADFQAMLRLTKLLRNAIHHEVLGEGVAIDQRRPGSRVPVAAIPEADAESVEAACRQLRKHGEWLLDLRDVVPDGALMIRAPLVTEGLLELGVYHCRQILNAAWPAAVDPAEHALQSSGWDRNPMLLSQTLKLHGLDHLDRARR